MFKIIRYIIIFIVIMLCLFILDKTNIGQKVKSFFVDTYNNYVFKNDTNINNVNLDNKEVLATTSSETATTVKSFVQEVLVEKPKNTGKISIDGIIYYTNIERSKVGLSPLVKSIKLNSSAGAKTDDMFSAQYFEHVAPDGETAADLVKSFDYKFQIVGENLALGIFQTDQTLVQAWMNSPTHKANILNPKFTEIGAAVGIGEYKGQKQWIAVQHFAKPIPLCTEIDESVQLSINIEKTALELDERELQKRAGVIESDPTIDKEYINEYNNMVNDYNERLNKLREVIANFNDTIVEYNTCVKG